MVEILQAVTPDKEIGNIDVSDRIYVVSRGKVKSAERVPRHLLKPKERATQTICVSSKFGLLLQISECDVHIREWTNQEGTGEEDYYMEMESFMAKEGVNLAQERDAIAEPPIWACLEAKKPLLGLKLCPWSETLVAAWSLDNTFFMFDLGGLTRNAKRSPLWRKQLSVQDVAFLEDERVAVVSEDSLQLFNAADGEDISSSEFSDESLRGLACASGFEGDSKSIIAVGMDDGSVHLFQTNNLEQRGSFQIESEELEGNVNANALAWMSESVLAVGFRSAVAIVSDEDDDDPPPLPALAVVQLDLQSAQVIASQFLSDPLDYSIRDKSWEHRFFMQRIPHLNGMVLTSTWSRNMAIFTIADGDDFAIERNKVMMRQDPVETPEICGGSIWSLAERPWVLADNGDDDPEIGFQENPFVLGMAMALCVKAKVAPDHIYGTDGELEGKPHFAPPPTIVVSTTDGILEHFAFADTEYSTTSSAATIPGMCLTTSSLPTARSVPSPAKSDNKVNSKPTSGMGGSAFDFSSSAPSSTTFGATAQSKAGDAQSGKTDLFTGKSTGAGSLFSTSSSSSSSTEKVSNGSLFGEASKSAVGSSNSEAKSSFGFGAMSNSLSSQPTQSLFGGSSSSSSTEKVSNGSLFGEASKSAVGSSNSEAKSSSGFGAMSNSLSSQPTQSLFGGSSTSFGTAAAAQPQGNGTSSLFGNSGGGTSSTGGSLFGSTATTSSFENRSKSETKGDVPFTGAQEGMIYTCRDGVTGYYKDCPPTVTFVPPEQRVFTRDEARILLTDFYKRIDPTKLGGVEGILDKYEGKYSAVFDRLSGKYKDQKVDLSLIAKSSNAIISNANVNDDAKAKADADARAKADADARAKADADARAKADADARAKADADARAKADADARAKADADARAKADADARAKADANARAKADADARAKADADTRAKADADARTKADADARAKADADARVKADANARAKANADAKAKANADAETMHVTTMKSNTENVYRETIAGLRESLNEQEARNEKLQAELNTQVRAKRLSSAPRLSLMKLRLEKDEGIYEPRGHLTKMKESLNKSTDPEEETRRLLRSTLNLVQAKDEDMQEDIARMTMTWPENDEELEDKTKTLRDNIEEALSFAQNDVKKLVREGADFLAATRRNYLNYLSLFESVKNQMHSRMRSLQPDGHNSGPSFDQGFESIEHAPQIETSDEELAELLLHLQSANKRVHDLERFREMMEHQMTSLRETLQNQQRTISLSQRNPPDQRDSRRVVALAASNETYVERQRQLMRRAMSMYKRARTSFDEMRSLYARLNGINSRLKAAIDDVEDIDEIEQGKIGEFSDQSALVPTLSNNGGSPSLTKTYEQELADLDSIDAMIKEHISAQPIIMRDSTGQEMRQARPLKEARSAARKELRWRRSLAAKTSRQSVEADGTLTDDGSLDFINSFSQRRPGLTEKQEEALSHMADPPKLRPVVSEEAVGASWSDTKPGAQTKPSDKKSSTFGPGSGGLFGAKSQSSNEVSGSFASQEPSQEEAEQEKEEKKSSGLFGNTSGSSSSSSLFLGQGGTSQTKNEEAPKPPFTPKKAEGASSSLFGVAGQALSSSNNSRLIKEVTDSNDGKQQNSPEAPKSLFGNTTQQTPSTPSSSSTGLFGASSSSSGLFGTSTPATPSSPAPSVANSERDLTNVDIRKTLAEFYREHKPELISKLDQNMEKYKQNFNHMFDLLEKKYRTKIKLIPNDGTGESSGGSNSVFGSTSMSSGLGGTGSSGFGNQASSNTGFGQSSSGFGQSSSGFGQSSSGFGTSTPSASSFGSSQPLGSSGFGASTSTPVGGSMFGGQQQQQTPGGGNNMDARQRLVEFYQKQNPEKLNSVDKTLERYRGRETELFAQLEKKYGPGSTGFFAGGNTGGQAMGSGGAFGATPGGFGNSSGFGASGSSGGFGSSGFGTPSSNGMGAQSAGANGGGFAGFAGSSSSSFGSPAAATSGSGGFGNSSGGFGSSSGGGASGFGASSSGGSSGFGTNSGFGTSAGGGSSGFNNGGGFGTSSSGSSGGFGSSGFGSAPTGGGFGGNASSFGGNTGGGSGFGGTAGGGGFGGSSGGGFGGFGGNSGGGGGSSFSGSSFTNMRG